MLGVIVVVVVVVVPVDAVVVDVVVDADAVEVFEFFEAPLPPEDLSFTKVHDLMNDLRTDRSVPLSWPESLPVDDDLPFAGMGAVSME